MKDAELQKVYEKYLDYFNKKDYTNAKETLLLFIKEADKNGNRGTYYYTLEYLLNDISLQGVDKKITQESLNLSNDYKEAMKSRNFNKSLLIAELQYKLTDGKDFYSILHVADAYIELNSYDNAKKYLDKALEFNPDSPRANALLTKYYIRKNNPKTAEEVLKKVKKLDKKNKYYYFLYRYEVACLTGSTGELSNFIDNVRFEISARNYSRFLEEKNKFDSWFRDSKTIIKSEKKKNQEDQYKMHLANMEKFLIPDENNVVRPRLVLEYLDNLDLDDNTRGLYNLETAKYLATNGYFDLANQLIRKTEKIKDKSLELKHHMKTLSMEMRLIKNR